MNFNEKQTLKSMFKSDNDGFRLAREILKNYEFVGKHRFKKKRKLIKEISREIGVSTPVLLLYCGIKN